VRCSSPSLAHPLQFCQAATSVSSRRKQRKVGTLSTSPRK
jgi:hypothetical protein